MAPPKFFKYKGWGGGGVVKKLLGAIMVMSMRTIIIIVGQTRKGAILSPHECENGDSYDNCDDGEE